VGDDDGARRAPGASSATGAAGPDEEEILAERGEVAQSLIEIAARDLDRTDADEKALARERERKPATFYSDLIYTLAHIRYPEDEARLVWVNLITHKAEMSQLLGRNVGVRVAALDFFRNRMGVLGDVKIMQSAEYIETAKLAVTDGLTGAYNHRYFQERLRRAMERASREGAPVSVLMIDIDHFKKYNDVNGHTAGDVALREVASAIGRVLGRDGILARYGGEEFAAILVGRGKTQAIEVAEKLRTGVESLPIPKEGDLPRGKLTVSVGAATYPEDGAEAGELVDWADLSMYLAKTGGRNRVAACPADHRCAERLSAGIRGGTPAQGPRRVVAEGEPTRRARGGRVRRAAAEGAQAARRLDRAERDRGGRVAPWRPGTGTESSMCCGPFPRPGASRRRRRTSRPTSPRSPGRRRIPSRKPVPLRRPGSRGRPHVLAPRPGRYSSAWRRRGSSSLRR
jgi:diguanylate cyclase (GGDEF)-like protein